MVPSRGDQRFPRNCHLRRSSEFARNRRKGIRRHTQHFVVCVSPGPQPEARLGLVVGRKVGTAVVRNRIKRLVREVFRTRRNSFPPHSDVVVIAKKTAAMPGFQTTRREILGCIEKLAQTQ